MALDLYLWKAVLILKTEKVDYWRTYIIHKNHYIELDDDHDNISNHLAEPDNYIKLNSTYPGIRDKKKKKKLHVQDALYYIDKHLNK